MLLKKMYLLTQRGRNVYAINGNNINSFNRFTEFLLCVGTVEDRKKIKNLSLRNLNEKTST